MQQNMQFKSVALCALIVLGIAVALFLRFGPTPIKYKVFTVNVLLSVRRALLSYQEQYEQFPAHCDTYEELVQVLGGRDLQGQNPKQIDFFEPAWRKVQLGGYLLDGWGHPFLLKRDESGTNMIIRSVGRNGVDNGGKYDDCEINTSDLDEVR